MGLQKHLTLFCGPLLQLKNHKPNNRKKHADNSENNLTPASDFKEPTRPKGAIATQRQFNESQRGRVEPAVNHDSGLRDPVNLGCK